MLRLKKELFPRDHHHLPIFLSFLALLIALPFALTLAISGNDKTTFNSHANIKECIPLPPCYYKGSCPIYNNKWMKIHWCPLESSKTFEIMWKTSHAQLYAHNLTITANGKTYIVPSSNVDIYSDPGSPTDTTLEARWHENSTEMRLNIYFVLDTQNNFWNIKQIKTFNGNTPGDWIYYKGFSGRLLGQAYQASPLDLTSESGNNKFGGRIHADKFSLEAFTDKLNPGCYYKPVVCNKMCVQGNPNCCPATLVCPNVTPVQPTQPVSSLSPTCTPRPACLDATPKCMIAEPANGWCQPNNITSTPRPNPRICHWSTLCPTQKAGDDTLYGCDPTRAKWVCEAH